MASLASVVVRRLLYGGLTIFLLVTGVFFLMRFVGDPVSALAGPDPTVEQIETIRRQIGLDLPVWEQYSNFLRDLIRLDMGDSLRTGQPAFAAVLARMPATLQLTAVALGLAALVGIPVGVISAVWPGSVIDTFSRVGAVVGQSMPVFWLGIILIIVFAVDLGWLPPGGREGLRSLILPGLTLSVYSIPITMRLTRSAMLEVLNKDYIRTARQKGISEYKVITKHALRSALIPVITVLALRLGFIITGAIVLEEVFGYPGMGRLAIQALMFRDFPVIQAFVVVVAVLIVLTNLLADVLYTVVDPRVRVS